jgi:Protein of unknown function (DUF3309)
LFGNLHADAVTDTPPLETQSATRSPYGREPPRLQRFTPTSEENRMSLGTILLIVLILMLVGVIPTWPHSKSWGYAPSGVVGLIVIILLVLVLMGRL